MEEKYSELACQFREKANEHMFLLAKYSNITGKDLWGCICSAMDWIDVGVQYIEKFQPSGRHGLQNCIEIYSFITAIDITYEAIISLFWVLQKNGEDGTRGRTPFYQKKGCFSAIANTSITDDRFFKEIRACCGAHPTDLETLISDDEAGKKQYRFASWTYVENNESFNVTLYPENATGKMITVKIFYSELIEYFEQRFCYLNTLIDRIDELYAKFKKEKASEPIPKSSDPLEWLRILKAANTQRLNNEYYNEIINQFICFLNTDFESKANEPLIENYKSKLVSEIETLYHNIQHLDYGDMLLDKLLNPPALRVDWFGYEFAALSGQVLSSIYKPYNREVVTEPLKGIVCFDNVHTDRELYWLIVIALNIKEESKHTASPKSGNPKRLQYDK